MPRPASISDPTPWAADCVSQAWMELERDLPMLGGLEPKLAGLILLSLGKKLEGASLGVSQPLPARFGQLRAIW